MSTSDIDETQLMHAFSLKRTLIAGIILSTMSPIALSALPSFFILLIEGYRPFLEDIVEITGLSDTNLAMLKLGYANLENTVLSLFLPIFPFDFKNIQVAESDVMFVLFGCIFILFLCVGTSRIAHSAALGLRAETIEDVKKRGIAAKPSTNRAFFRAILFIPFVMLTLYTLVALLPVAENFDRNQFQAADFIQEKTRLPASLVAICLAVFLTFLFLQWVAKLRSMLTSSLITGFSLIFWLGINQIMPNIMHHYGYDLPYIAHGLQNARVLAFYAVPGFGAYILACIFTGIIIRHLRRRKAQSISTHWIRER